MVKISIQSSDWIRLSDWECNEQTDWIRTRSSLDYHQVSSNYQISPLGWSPIVDCRLFSLLFVSSLWNIRRTMSIRFWTIAQRTESMERYQAGYRQIFINTKVIEYKWSCCAVPTYWNHSQSQDFGRTTMYDFGNVATFDAFLSRSIVNPLNFHYIFRSKIFSVSMALLW